MASANPEDEEMALLTENNSTNTLLQRYIDCAEFLICKCHTLQHIIGIQKLERKCLAELKYLKSLSRQRGGCDSSHLRSSNLSHYIGVIHAAEHLPDVSNVLQAFQCPGRTEALHVDVVAGQGHIWAKVVARKAQALHFVWSGQGNYGEKDLIVQANDYLLSSREHPVNFNEPKLVFLFYNGVTNPMAEHLEKLGVSIVGNKVEVTADLDERLAENEQEFDIVKSKDGLGRKGDENILLDGNCDDLCESKLSSITLNPTNCSALNQTAGAGITTGTDLTNRVNETSEDDTSLILNSEPLQKTDCAQSNHNCDRRGDQHKAETNPSLSDETKLSLPDESDRNCDISRFIFSELLLPIPDFSGFISAFRSCPRNSVDSITRVNLDVTALVTLVSNVSNGCCHFRFKEAVLSHQAEDERANPVKPDLDSFLEGKELFSCETAIESFKSILDILGGENERKRAAALLERLRVTPDNPSYRTTTLMNTGKIKARSKIIFGTGDSLKAVTVTANSGFVRAAEKQGVLYAVYIHSSRALTEQKEPLAEKLAS